MALYCNTAIIQSLRGLSFPAGKADILHVAGTSDAPEAVVVALNQLSDQVIFLNMDGVCENISLNCSVEVYRTLATLVFPASGQEIVDFAKRKGASDMARSALGELARAYVFGSVEEVCRNVAF
jgi:hypothetical protein